MGTWQDLKGIASTMYFKCPEGFWPASITEYDKVNRLLDFERQIFPIWSGIITRDIEADKKMTAKEVAAQTVLLECVTMHRQDWAILKSGIQVNRVAPMTGDFRKKAAAGEKFSQWWQK